MSQRPKRGGEKSPRDSHPTPLGSLRARDGGGTSIISEDFADSGQDDADLVETEGQEALLALQSAIDGLSQSQLLSIKDLVNKAAQPTRAQKSLRLRTIVDEHLQFLLTEDASATYDELWHDLADADARTWTSIFSSLRPPSDLKPDLTEFPFHDLVDFRPKGDQPRDGRGIQALSQAASDRRNPQVDRRQAGPPAWSSCHGRSRLGIHGLI